MATKSKVLVAYTERITKEVSKRSARAALEFLGPIYRGLKSSKALIGGKLDFLKPLIVSKLTELRVDEFVATRRTFLMLTRPIVFPKTFERSKAMVPKLRALLVRRYGGEAVKGKIYRVRIVSYHYIMEGDLRKRIEADDPEFRRRVSILMGATPELRVSEVSDRVKTAKERKGRRTEWKTLR